MDSHQVEGQQRCAFARSKRLQRVKTAARGAPLPKGSFLRGCELTVPATSSHPICKKIAMPSTGFKVQPPQADGRSKGPILQSSRSRSCSAGRHPMQAVRPQFDQSNWNYRPLAAVDCSGFNAKKPSLIRRLCGRLRRPREGHSGAGQRQVCPPRTAQNSLAPAFQRILPSELFRASRSSTSSGVRL